MGASERRKGADAEREVARILAEHGISAKRGQVFNHEPDVIAPDLPLHLEIKRQETTKIWDWFCQSRDQARGLIPSVVFRRNRSKWMICMELEDFLRLYKGEQDG